MSSLPAIIPASKSPERESHERSGRTIVMCLDGTGDQFDGDNSNVVKLFAALKKDDPTQLTYYQSGVGTYSSSKSGSLKTGFAAALDMAVGASLGEHVREAYEFLMQNYKEGDRICLFGFSRGAYTVRALGGMLHKVGLLPAHNQAQITFAYKWYKDNSTNGWKMSADFKQTFSIDVDIHFMGCWDTVASVGFIPRILPFAKTNNKAVMYFRHALALDERRAKFKANHWRQRYVKNEGEDEEAEAAYDREGNMFERALEAQHKRALHLLEREKDEHKKDEKRESAEKQNSARESRSSGISPSTTLSSLFSNRTNGSAESAESAADDIQGTTTQNDEKQVKRKSMPIRQNSKAARDVRMMKEFNEVDAHEFGKNFDTDVKEVWFLGCHADCGGGAVPNETRHMVSRIPLRWMIRQTFECETGILFRSDVLAEHGLDLDSLWPEYVVRETPKFGPSPSMLDRFATTKLPDLQQRRASVRSHLPRSISKASALADESVIASEQQWPQLWHSLTQRWQHTGVLTEQDEDYFDCLAQINDQLVHAKGWWILELWPIKYRILTDKGRWVKKTGPNLGRPRSIRTPTPNIHWTVLQRQKSTEYEIQCALEDGVRINVVC